MRSSKMWLLASVFLWGFAQLSVADTIAGVTVEKTVKVSNQMLVLQGAGLREKFFIDVYVGALYLKQRTENLRTAVIDPGPKRMAMHIVHGTVDANKWRDGWRLSIKNNNPQKIIDENQKIIDEFVAFFDRDLKKGDVVLIDYSPGQGTQVTLGDKQSAFFPGKNFNRLLLNTWLGPKPPSSKFQKGIMGK